MRHIFTDIRCHVVRGLVSAIFLFAFAALLQAAPASSGGKTASTGKATAANSERSEVAANKEAETHAPQAANTQAADQEDEADAGRDPDMPTVRHGDILVGTAA